MNPVIAVVLTVLLGSSMYLAGRLHARVGYRFGYRYGYRQGYFDGDRACWNRLRRDSHVGTPEAIEATPVPVPRAAVVGPPSPPLLPAERNQLHLDAPAELADVPGTTYTSAAALGRHSGTGYPNVHPRLAR